MARDTAEAQLPRAGLEARRRSEVSDANDSVRYHSPLLFPWLAAIRAIRHMRVRARSTQPPDEVEFEAGQWSADFMHCSTRYERSEVDGDKSGAVDQLDH
jgi:hypothetical protein